MEEAVVETTEDSQSLRYTDTVLQRFKINQHDMINGLSSVATMFLAIGALITLIILMIRFCWQRIHIKVQKIVLAVKAKLMYNSIIRYILQSFFFVALSAMLNLRYAIVVEGNALNVIASMLVLILLIAFTVYSYTFMKRN